MEPSSRSRVRAAFRDYGADHRTRGNRLCHAIGVPLIVFSLLGLCARIGASEGLLGPTLIPALAAPRADAGFALWLVSLAYYLRLDPRLGAPFSICTFGFYLVARETSLAVNVACFILGWGFQLVGHARYERRRPSFLRNLSHLLVGPLWIFAHAVRDAESVQDDGLRRAL